MGRGTLVTAATAGLQRPRVYMPYPVAEVSLAKTTRSGNRG
jgi:hypothetical protein